MIALIVGGGAALLAIALVLWERRQGQDLTAEAEGLFNMAAAMASTLNVKEVFEIVLDQAVVLTGADSGLLLRVSRGGMLVAATYASVRPLGVDLLREAAAAEHAITAAGRRALLVPIPSSEAGGFVLQLQRSTPFSGADRLRAEKLAAVATIAIANAFRYGARTEEATRDSLTGTLNRREFEQRLGEELSRIGRGGAPASLLLIDVDHFKAVNDTFGHARGDEVLVGVAAIMGQSLRPHDLAGRLGGDEFAVLLPDTPTWAARRVAERLAARIREAAMPAGPVGQSVTLSIGIATAPQDGCAVPGLLGAADRALYSVKRRGRDGIAQCRRTGRRPRLVEGAA
ncbi:MAG TPA: GGDEF domain-containing protein [Candidatus Dormibacteraeota bacterium]